MKKLVPIALLLVCHFAFAQYPVGHRTITYNDPSRSNRAIACEVYYPGVSSGNDVAVAVGEFPLVVVGHGFSMAVAAYQNWWEEFVPSGYIFVLPTTEGGLFTVSHGDFGLDLAFVADAMQASNSNGASPFFEKVRSRTALMGHSMGGGATILAAANNTTIDCIIGLAPAETNPSAAAAGSNVTVPTLILHGTEDQVTPEADHALLIYDGLASVCKFYARLDEGAHCFFANYNFFCATGEMNIGTLTREEQQALSYTLVGPWLAYFLMDECSEYGVFETEFATNLQLGPNLESCSNNTPFITESGGTLTSDQQTNYQWYLNSNEIANADGQTFAYTQSGTYQVGTVNLGNCLTLSNEIVVQITGLMEPQLSIKMLENHVLIRSQINLHDISIEWSDLSGRVIENRTLSSVVGDGSISLSKPRQAGVKMLRLRSAETSTVWKVF